MYRQFVIKIIIPILIIVEISFLFFAFMSYSNKSVDKIKETSKINKNVFSVYVMDDNGDYQEVIGSEYWPGENYLIDETKSSCVNNKGEIVSNDVMSYNNGELTIIGTQSVFCYIYFGIFSSEVEIAISLNGTTGTNQTGKYHKIIDCGTTGSATFNPIYQRVEIGNAISPAVCLLTYTADSQTYTTLKSEVETVNINQNYDNNGYRYSGKKPNNWIWFNGEKWRIIGSIPTCTSSGCATSENLVKIIRNAPIGTYAYDASSTTPANLKGAWGKNTLYRLLNTYYYASSATAMNGQNHSGCSGYYASEFNPKPNCDYTGIGIVSSSYYGKMVKNVYWNTGGNSLGKTPKAAYTNETSIQTIPGYIGLITYSDYSYAIDSSYHSKSSISSEATATNWLFNGDQWTSTRYVYSSDTSYAIYVNNYGYVYSSNVGYLGNPVRPVLYLDASVYIISGDGTEGNPYQIGM